MPTQPGGGRRWAETWRVLAYTLAISLAFIALGKLQLAAMGGLLQIGALVDSGLFDRNSAAQLDSEAAQVEQASRAALQRLPSAHRRATFRLGYELGYASEWAGSFAMSPKSAQSQAQVLTERRLAVARVLAQLLGVGEVGVLRVENAQDFGTLKQRIENDENGLAGRFERQLSLHHRHLYLLGMHVGTASARVEMSAGAAASPETLLIRRHASAAGIAPALWKPLASPPGLETPAQIVARYRAGLEALDASLGQPIVAPPLGSR